LDSALARGTIEASAVQRLLAQHSAVVLERIARGGGSTRWFFVQRPDQLEALAAALSPGSSVSFYFDDRIKRVELVPEVAEQSFDLQPRTATQS
jgi:hypothetical protein